MGSRKTSLKKIINAIALVAISGTTADEMKNELCP
jgi:hypothetical protein